MAKYRKKPVVIEAEQWFKHGDDADVRPWSPTQGINCFGCKKPFCDHGTIKTLEGSHIVCPGDWIITGVKGEKYPCKPDIFEQTYEKVSTEVL